MRQTFTYDAAMKTQDAINFFGSQVALKKALNLKARQTIHAWGEYPPPGRQFQIEVLTNGKLKAEQNDVSLANPSVPD